MATQEASAYQALTSELAQSTCERAAITDWIGYEYPLWVGLQHDHWHGLLNDFDVANQTSKLVPSYRPCATIRQVGTGYITPHNGMVNLPFAADPRFGNLALSVDPNRALTIRTSAPRFESTVAGTRVFPGGGWSLTSLGQLPLLVNGGSVYVTSTVSRSVDLQLDLVPRVSQPELIVTTPGGHRVPTIPGRSAIVATLPVHKGSNRIDLSLRSTTPSRRAVLVLQGVTVASPPRPTA